MKYKHYSFDLWGTLIKSNTRFKEERVAFFQSQFNKSGLFPGQIAAIIRNVDKMCDFTNETSGLNVDAAEMVSMVLYNMGYLVPEVKTMDIESIYRSLESLFEMCQPEVYSRETVFKLKDLKSRGATLSILSNTAFIRGKALRKYIDNSPFNGLFDFQLYSDEMGYSKPNPIVFSQLLSSVRGLKKFDPASPWEIVHVGDNPNADKFGANQCGIEAILINCPDKTPKTIIHVP